MAFGSSFAGGGAMPNRVNTTSPNPSSNGNNGSDTVPYQVQIANLQAGNQPNGSAQVPYQQTLINTLNGGSPPTAPSTGVSTRPTTGDNAPSGYASANNPGGVDPLIAASYGAGRTPPPAPAAPTSSVAAPAPQPAAPQPQPWQAPNWDWNKVDNLWGGNPLALLSGNSTGSGVLPFLNNINSNRAALGGNLINNNGYGTSGIFSPVVTNPTTVNGGNLGSVAGANSTTGNNSLGNFFGLLGLLGMGGANASNNYTS